jgi:UDP-glucose 4-epimerase
MHEQVADPLAAFRRVNVEGTRSVHAAAAEAGVRRLVYLSSIKAMGEGGAVPYRETDQPLPVDPYGISKWEAEQALAQARARGGPEYVVLRPTLVYGPGVGGNVRRLLRLAELSRWIPVPLGRIANRRSLISVNNLVSGITTVARHPGAADRTFLVSDGEDLSTSELLARLAAGLGIRPLLLPCPTRLLRALAALAGRTADLDRLLGSLSVDSSLIRDQLGWRPPESATAAIAATAAWWAGRRNLAGRSRPATEPSEH